MVGLIRVDAEVQICATAVTSSTSGLAGSSAPASLDQNKGRVRLLKVRRVHPGRNRGTWRSGSTAGASSSSQHSEEGIFPPGQQRGKGLSLGYWRSIESVWEGNDCPVGGCGGLRSYKSERVGLGRFGHVGLIGGLWLGNKGGGEDKGESRGGTLLWKGRCCKFETRYGNT
jgi:hypothetical protein